MVESKLRNPACAGGIMVGIVGKGKKKSRQGRGKYEARNPKFETNSNIQRFKIQKLVR